ncbi:hypothetical protein Xen7305DRAFT_00013090 [Xenococcus sp. PCC 7305]|uniref:hypothetical protein n=1 Tax=Xenococcus sp. PCC 7305 TaxID=102125 RepID=UPI0002AC9C82|nr:hypothetical protein [Xenococcus sp. PCC 7305]ELS01605.1 hypothetical protein Xen7305DRAFT_00013090 [Xenococcus sp. PCC 7305]
MLNFKSLKSLPSAIALSLILLSSTGLLLGCRKESSQSSSNATATVKSTLQGKPRGLFLNTANLPTQEWSRIERYILNDPTVTGANIVIPWSLVDQGPGATSQYNWSYVYQQAKPWIEAGKTVNILLWGAAQRSQQEFNGKSITPEYVLKNTDTVSCQCKIGKGCEIDPPQTPVFWDEDYQDNYRKVVRAAIAEFGDQPWLGYFRFGIGVGAESYPGNGVTYAKNPCTKEWTKPSIGLSPELWQEHSLDFIDFLASIETEKTILVTINNYGKSYDIAREVAAHAAAQGFGIGTQGLTKNALNLYAQGKNCYADWCSLFKKYDATTVLEVQTAAQSNPAGRGRVGPLPPLLDFGLAKGVDIFELYQAEWFVANDPDHHLYQKYGASYREALKKAAEELR